jgi:hypothetical protein
VRLVIETGLVLLSVVALERLWRVRSGCADLPLLAAAGIGAAAVAYGGRHVTYVWGVAAVGFIACAVLMAAGERPSRPTGAAPAAGGARLVLAGVMFMWFGAVDFAVGKDAFAHLVSYGVVAVALTACALILAHGGLSSTTAARTGLVLVAVSDIAGVISPAAWRPCDQFKCSALGALFRGPYPSENFLAFVATMTLAWTLTSMRGGMRMYGAALCAATVFATGSRTALVVSAVCLLALAVSAGVGRVRARPATGVPWAVALSGALAAAAAGIYLLEHARTATFSNRGTVWIQALATIEDHRSYGVGLSSYHVLQQQAVLSTHFTHSEYLLLLFAGGYVGIGLFVVWAATTMHTLARAAQSAAAATPVLAFVIYGLTEVTWNPLAFDSFAWVALALTITTGRPTVERAVEGAQCGVRASPLSAGGVVASTGPVLSATRPTFAAGSALPPGAHRPSLRHLIDA